MARRGLPSKFSKHDEDQEDQDRSRRAMSSSRGLRLLRALEAYARSEPHRGRWDAANVFSKVTLDSASEGVLRAHFVVDGSMSNSGDHLHGGFVASLVDTAALFGYVSHPLGKVAWTTRLDINYIRKAGLGERIDVETTPLRIHSAGGLIDCYLRNTSGELVARGTANLLAASPAAKEFTQIVSNNLNFDFSDSS